MATEPGLLLIVERGEDLPRLLLDTCVLHGVTTALVEGSGRASSLTLEGGPSGRRKVAGPLEVLHIAGTVDQVGARLEPVLRCVASREMDTGLEIVGGVLIEGIFESASVRISRHVHPSVVDASASSWATIAAASERLADAGEEEPPRVGDTVEHPKFGACVVRGIDDEHLMVRLEGGRTISLRLSHLSFELKGELSNGKRLYALVVRRGE